eukprot:15475463-Alexandrium_andersonii.AAC.1
MSSSQVPSPVQPQVQAPVTPTASVVAMPGSPAQTVPEQSAPSHDVHDTLLRAAPGWLLPITAPSDPPASVCHPVVQDTPLDSSLQGDTFEQREQPAH